VVGTTISTHVRHYWDPCSSRFADDVACLRYAHRTCCQFSPRLGGHHWVDELGFRQKPPSSDLPFNYTRTPFALDSRTGSSSFRGCGSRSPFFSGPMLVLTACLSRCSVCTICALVLSFLPLAAAFCRHFHFDLTARSSTYNPRDPLHLCFIRFHTSIDLRSSISPTSATPLLTLSPGGPPHMAFSCALSAA
jgi:hypothetical protein